MNRTLGSIVAVIVAALLAVSVYASPYWTLYRLKVAAERHDGDAISHHVDYPAVRASVKEQMLRLVEQQMQLPGLKDNPAAATMKAWETAMIGPLVDTLVSPANLAAAFHGKSNAAEPGKPRSRSDDAVSEDLVLNYRSWSDVALCEKGHESEGCLVFRRQGLWMWKLVAIEIPHLMPAPG